MTIGLPHRVIEGIVGVSNDPLCVILNKDSVLVGWHIPFQTRTYVVFPNKLPTNKNIPKLFIYLFICETGYHYVAQADPELLASNNPPTPAT